MKNRALKKCGWLFIALTILLLVRVSWIASHAESGWLTLLQPWQQFIGGDQVDLPARKPEAQAKFWLNTIRQHKTVSHDANLAPGERELGQF